MKNNKNVIDIADYLKLKIGSILVSKVNLYPSCTPGEFGLIVHVMKNPRQQQTLFTGNQPSKYNYVVIFEHGAIETWDEVQIRGNMELITARTIDKLDKYQFRSIPQINIDMRPAGPLYGIMEMAHAITDRILQIP